MKWFSKQPNNNIEGKDMNVNDIKNLKKAIEEARKIGDSVQEEQIKDEFKDMELRRILRNFLKDFDENLAVRRINELFSFMEQL